MKQDDQIKNAHKCRHGMLVLLPTPVTTPNQV